MGLVPEELGRADVDTDLQVSDEHHREHHHESELHFLGNRAAFDPSQPYGGDGGDEAADQGNKSIDYCRGIIRREAETDRGSQAAEV